MSRRSVAIGLLVFVLVVYGMAFLFSDRFPGLLPVGFSGLGDIAPLEAPTAIAGEQFAEPVEPEDPGAGGEPNLLGRIVILFEPIIIVAAAFLEALSSAVGTAVAVIASAFSGILDPLVSLATFNLPALSGNILFEFLRIGVVSVVLMTLAFLIFDLVRSVVPFLPG